MKALLIAEKPSLMRDIEKVYKKLSLPYEIEFAAFVGHVVELKEPHEYKPEWKKWNLDLLPMMPERYEFRVKKTSAKVHKEIVTKLKSNHYDFIINACDAGMEGENIFYSFYKQVKCQLPVKRFWTSQTTDNAIEKALKELIDENDPLIRNLRNAAMYRMVFDWLIGINLTRVATVKGGRTIKVGRVMTPTLAIVVERELEILNFKPVPYFQVELTLPGFKALWIDLKSKEQKLEKIESARAVVSTLEQTAEVVNIDTEQKTIYAPPLHSLLELQKEANKFYGFTSQQTLKIAQSLYEKKLITYPRTESKHLPTEFARQISSNLSAIAAYEPFTEVANSILQNREHIQKTMRQKKYVDDKKLTDHHAITVTDQSIGRKKLSHEEKKVYELICKRLLAIFMPPYVYNKTAMYVKSGEHYFKANGQMVVDKGFTVLYETKKQGAATLPLHTKGDVLLIEDAQILSKLTEPPPRYTDSTLLDAMFHAGRFVEDKTFQAILKDAEGIGTSATRAEIIEKLLQIGMIERMGKSFKATSFGIEVITSLNGHDVTSPVLTAIWSKKLKDIVDGNLPSSQFYKELLHYVQETTAALKNTEMTVAAKEDVIVGACIKCKSPVKENFKTYNCTSKECDFYMTKRIMGANITANDMRKLLKNEVTRDIRFTWKSGKKSKAKLKLNGEKLEFVFPQPMKKK